MSEFSYKRRVRNVAPGVQQVASDLRKSMTPAEKKLWQSVRNSLLAGLKVRRQYPVDRFVLDFYIPECRFAIEIDGPTHDDQHIRDEERTSVLSARNIRVIRFANEEVITNLADVLARIRAEAEANDA